MRLLDDLLGVIVVAFAVAMIALSVSNYRGAWIASRAILRELTAQERIVQFGKAADEWNPGRTDMLIMQMQYGAGVSDLPLGEIRRNAHLAARNEPYNWQAMKALSMIERASGNLAMSREYERRSKALAPNM